MLLLPFGVFYFDSFKEYSVCTFPAVVESGLCLKFDKFRELTNFVWYWLDCCVWASFSSSAGRSYLGDVMPCSCFLGVLIGETSSVRSNLAVFCTLNICWLIGKPQPELTYVLN